MVDSRFYNAVIKPTKDFAIALIESDGVAVGDKFVYTFIIRDSYAINLDEMKTLFNTDKYKFSCEMEYDTLTSGVRVTYGYMIPWFEDET